MMIHSSAPRIGPLYSADRTLMFILVATTASAAWAGPGAHLPASATSCEEQVLEPGQEAQIETLLALPGGVDATGLESGDIRVEAASLTAHWRGELGDTPTTWTWRIAARRPAAPQNGLAATRLAPCAVGSSKSPDDVPKVLCESAAGQRAVIAADKRINDRLAQAGHTLRWRCATTDATDGWLDLGAAMREIDRLLSVANKTAAQRSMDSLLRALEGRKLGVHEAIDLAASLQRLGRDKEAAERQQAAVSAWRAQTEAGDSQAAGAVVMERVAAAQVALGQVDEGLRLLEACPDQAHVPACNPLPVADALERTGRTDEAAELLDNALADAQNATPALHLARIGLASRMEAGEQELAAAEAAVKRHADNPELLNALACAHFRAGQFGSSIAVFEKVYRAAPAFRGTLARLSGAFNQMAGRAGSQGQPTDQWQTLRKRMEQRAESNPNDVVALFMRGVAQYYDGELEAAIASMKQVEPKVPNEARVYIYQGMAHHWLGRAADAERMILRAREANPHDSDVYYCYSQVFHQKDRDGAIKSLKQYIAMSAAPGALQFTKKTDRVRQELALLEKGENLPDWDRPARTPVNSVPGEQGGGRAWPLLLAVLAGLTLAAGLLMWRRRRQA